VVDRDRILERMRTVDGWLEDGEADLLITSVSEALGRSARVREPALVEIGSFCGRSTVVVGSTIKAFGPTAVRLFAIDPHEGHLGSVQGTVIQTSGTLPSFLRTITSAGIYELVVPIVARATDVRWTRPVVFLFVDGLHDFASVHADITHFDPFVCTGGLVAFHDYTDSFPGVVRVVDNLLAGGTYRLANQFQSLVVLEKLDRDLRRTRHAW
jgi:hypothetical protein